MSLWAKGIATNPEDPSSTLEPPRLKERTLSLGVLLIFMCTMTHGTQMHVWAPTHKIIQ